MRFRGKFYLLLFTLKKSCEQDHGFVVLFVFLSLYSTDQVIKGCIMKFLIKKSSVRLQMEHYGSTERTASDLKHFCTQRDILHYVGKFVLEDM